MKTSLIEREVFVLDMMTTHVFKNSLHGAAFLLPWASMDPSVARRRWTGPTWEFLKNGRKAKAIIPLTAVLHSGELQYWDVEDTRRAVPLRVSVKQAHAEAEGVTLRMFDPDFIQANIIEYRNRRTGYFLLVQHRYANLAPLEHSVLAELGDKTRTLGQLCARLPDDEGLLKAAVMNLWRSGKVDVPSGTQLIGLDWPIHRSRRSA